MTLGVFGLGALTAAAGTRAAAILFIGAAVLGASGGTLPALVTWTAAMAAGLALVPGAPRRLAVPAFGAIAALGAGSARNTAVVLGLWVLATAAAVFSRGTGPEADRWAQTLCVADLPVVGAVAWTGVAPGFEGWPQQLDPVAVTLLLAAAAIRAPLISGPDDGSAEPGLLVVRAQAVVLLLLALGTSAGQDLVSTAAVLGALGFVAGGTATRATTRDGIQEIALVAVVLAAGRAGWGPAGWEWGALAAGTLVHNLRLRLEDDLAGPLARALHRGGGLGVPFLPVVLVGLEGATGAGGWVGGAVMLGLVGGMTTRAGAPRRHLPSSSARSGGRRSPWEAGVAGAVVAACVIGGLWAPVLTTPEGIAGEGIAWPPVWATAAVLLAGTAVATRVRAETAGPVEAASWLPVALPEIRLPARLANHRLLVASTAALALGAAAMWVVGVLRSFL